jgi:hypothetical protein
MVGYEKNNGINEMSQKQHQMHLRQKLETDNVQQWLIKCINWHHNLKFNCAINSGFELIYGSGGEKF